MKKSADVVGGRVRDAEGPTSMVAAMVTALRARGEIDRVTHRFHTYPARMHPDAARALLGTLPGARVLDPFCGGGTLLVEAMLAGRRAIGRDVNPVAVLTATARTRLLGRGEQKGLRANAERIVSHVAELAPRAEPPPLVAPLRSWYGRQALGELSALSLLIDDAPPVARPLLRAILSSLVVKYSQRASDTSARRVEGEPRRGAVTRAFAARADELVRMLGELRRRVPDAVEPADVAHGDARDIVVAEADLIVSSPPYPGTYDYLPMQHLRLAWLGASATLDAPADVEIGARRGFKEDVEAGYTRWQEATLAWLTSAAKALTPEGLLAILIGDGISDKRLLEARSATVRAAKSAGLAVRAAVSIERVDPATQLAKREHALVLRRA
jgi:DNA modification methylase